MRWLRRPYMAVFGSWWHYRAHGGEWHWIGLELINYGGNKVLECSRCGHITIV